MNAEVGGIWDYKGGIMLCFIIVSRQGFIKVFK